MNEMIAVVITAVVTGLMLLSFIVVDVWVQRKTNPRHNPIEWADEEPELKE